MENTSASLKAIGSINRADTSTSGGEPQKVLMNTVDLPAQQRKLQETLYYLMQNTPTDYEEDDFVDWTVRVPFSRNRTEPEDFTSREERPLLRKENVFDSNASEESEDSDDQNIFPYLVSKKGYFFRFVNIYCTLAIFGSVAFDSIKNAKFCMPTNEKTASVEIASSLIIDLAFVLEMLVRFLLPYKRVTKVMEHRLSRIALRYLTSWFVIDAFCAIPLSTLILTLKQSNNMRWLFIWRILKLAKLKSFKGLVITRNLEFNRVLKFFIIFLSTVHYLTCMFVCIGYTNYENTWVKANNMFEETSITTAYVASAYFHMISISTIGYGDILATNLTERVYNGLLLLLGVLLFSFAVSALSNFFTPKYDLNNTIIEGNFINLCIKHKIDYNMRERVLKMIGNMHEFKEREEQFNFIRNLPVSLRNQLILSMYKSNLKNLDFFSKKNNDFILFVMPRLNSHSMVKDEKILSLGEIPEEMFIVSKGKFNIFLGENYHKLKVGCLRRKIHFGDAYLYYNIQCSFDIVSSRDADIYIIKREDYLTITNKFPEITYPLLSTSMVRLEYLESVKIIMDKIIKNTNKKEILEKALRMYKTKFVRNDYDPRKLSYGDEGLHVLEEHAKTKNMQIIKSIVSKFQKPAYNKDLSKNIMFEDQFEDTEVKKFAGFMSKQTGLFNNKLLENNMSSTILKRSSQFNMTNSNKNLMVVSQQKESNFAYKQAEIQFAYHRRSESFHSLVSFQEAAGDLEFVKNGVVRHKGKIYVEVDELDGQKVISDLRCLQRVEDICDTLY